VGLIGDTKLSRREKRDHIIGADSLNTEKTRVRSSRMAVSFISSAVGAHLGQSKEEGERDESLVVESKCKKPKEQGRPCGGV